MRESRRLDAPLPQSNQPLGIGANLTERKVLIRIETLLPSQMAHEKIAEGAESRHANRFPFEILSTLYFRPHHQGLNDPRHGMRQYHHVRTREHRAHHR